MSRKYLIVVDMQEDFVYGSLGSPEAREIVPAVVEMVKGFGGTVLFTKDTHQNNYLDTQEGKFLPVPHCINLTKGWDRLGWQACGCGGSIRGSQRRGAGGNHRTVQGVSRGGAGHSTAKRRGGFGNAGWPGRADSGRQHQNENRRRFRPDLPRHQYGADHRYSDRRD